MVCAAAVCGLLLFGMRTSAEDDNPGLAGQWLTGEGQCRIEIWQAEDEKWYGKVAWQLEPNWPEGDPEAGKPRTDRRNPDPAKRGRPAHGLVILSGFVEKGKNYWGKGRVYNVETGKTYKAKMTLGNNGQELRLRGFIGVSLIGKTAVWTRYEPKDKDKDTDEDKRTAAPEEAQKQEKDT